MDTDEEIVTMEKVYVAVGNDFHQGLESLNWTLKNWSSQSFSIVILHVYNSSSREFVYSPLGKLPASSVTDEKLQLHRMSEQEKIDKSLSMYIDFSDKVNVEILKIEKSGEPIHKVIVETISNLRITKLVMGHTFMKSMSGKSKSTSNGASFYVQKNKPDFCELFIINEGNLVIVQEENNDGGRRNDDGLFVENDRRLTVLKDKGSSFKGWLGKMFTSDKIHHVAPTTECNYLQAESSDWWKNHVQEIEDYFQMLSIDPTVNVDMAEILKAKIEEAKRTTQEKKKETKESLDRKAKAEWIISLCERRVGELEKCIVKEITDKNELKRNLEASKQELHEVYSEIKDSDEKLKSILELQTELKKKLERSSAKKSDLETNLVKAEIEKAEIVRDIKKFGSQKDVFRRMIEFSSEEATSTMSVELDLYREFTVDELREATDDFSEGLRMKSRSGAAGTSVYRGMLNHTTVAIKFHTSLSSMSQEEFKMKMELLQRIRHPYLIAMIGACSELKCIIYEYMHHGSLHEVLFSFSITRNRILSWPIRIQIADQICSAVGFLHSSKPRPISHGNLNTSKILIDQHLVAKLTDFKLDHSDTNPEVKSDVYDFGILMMQLLTGRERGGLVKVVTSAVECGVLNEVAVEWPLDLANDFAQLALRCVRVELTMTDVRIEIEEMMMKKAEVDEVAEVDG